MTIIYYKWALNIPTSKILYFKPSKILKMEFLVCKYTIWHPCSSSFEKAIFYFILSPFYCYAGAHPKSAKKLSDQIQLHGEAQPQIQVCEI
jgi:hypothetical protein